MNWRRKAIALVTMAATAGLANAQITTALQSICSTFKSIVPIIAFLMFITAGVVYAGGQVMGAETRARANVWATAMLIGGIIGLIMAASASFLVQMFGQATLGGSTVSFAAVSGC